MLLFPARVWRGAEGCGDPRAGSGSSPKAAIPGRLSCRGALRALIPPRGCWRMWEHPATAVSPLALSCALARCPGAAPASAASCQRSSASLLPPSKESLARGLFPEHHPLGSLPDFARTF